MVAKLREKKSHFRNSMILAFDLVNSAVVIYKNERLRISVIKILHVKSKVTRKLFNYFW